MKRLTFNSNIMVFPLFLLLEVEVKESESLSAVFDSMRPHGLYSPWNSPGQNTGVGNPSLLQGIFPTQGSNPDLPHCRWILHQLSPKGSPRKLEWVPYHFSCGIPPTQELNQGLLHCRWILYLLSYQGSPYKQGFSKITVDYSWKSSNAQTQFCFVFFSLKHLFYFILFFIYFLQLEANHPTILQWVLSHIDMNQPWIYMYSPSQIPPPTSLSARSLWVFPVHKTRALVSCIQPGLVICFTPDNIHVSMLFSRNISPSPSPTESKVCSIHLCLYFCFAYRVIVTIFLYTNLKGSFS